MKKETFRTGQEVYYISKTDIKKRAIVNQLKAGKLDYLVVGAYPNDEFKTVPISIWLEDEKRFAKSHVWIKAHALNVCSPETHPELYV